VIDVPDLLNEENTGATPSKIIDVGGFVASIHSSDGQQVWEGGRGRTGDIRRLGRGLPEGRERQTRG
jgi:hypothetical protein